MTAHETYIMTRSPKPRFLTELIIPYQYTDTPIKEDVIAWAQKLAVFMNSHYGRRQRISMLSDETALPHEICCLLVEDAEPLPGLWWGPTSYVVKGIGYNRPGLSNLIHINGCWPVPHNRTAHPQNTLEMFYNSVKHDQPAPVQLR